MQSRFDKMIDRRKTGSMKWNVAEDELPMWVADMDFSTAPEITEMFTERIAHGIFGYTEIEEEWYQAYQSWWNVRHNFDIQKEWLVFCTGVVPAISSIVRKMTTVGEKVVVLTPVYNIFFNSILNNGRNALECKLLYKEGDYSINWEDLEEKLSDPQTSMMIFCNPHNPIGKIWDKATLEKIGELCEKYHVLVVSDEIHCDLTKIGKKYIPYASVSEKCRNNSITCVAPTKSFNLAGIQTAAVIIPNPCIRHKVNRGLNTDEVAEPNILAAIAPIVAFEKGTGWLDELRMYLWNNRKYAQEYIENEISDISVIHAEATYLLWIDCSRIVGDSSELCRFLREKTGLYLSDGREYRNGEGFLRMNLACPLERLMDGMVRLKDGILRYEQMICMNC